MPDVLADTSCLPVPDVRRALSLLLGRQRQRRSYQSVRSLRLDGGGLDAGDLYLVVGREISALVSATFARRAHAQFETAASSVVHDRTRASLRLAARRRASRDQRPGADEIPRLLRPVAPV